jgi:hypothetical protein
LTYNKVTILKTCFLPGGSISRRAAQRSKEK